MQAQKIRRSNILLSTVFKTPTRWLSVVWMIFVILVMSGIHGSSLTLMDAFWSPGKPDPQYVFSRFAGASFRVLGHSLDPSDFLMQPRAIRTDEYLVWIPYALSQFQHNPPFPVVNTNIGDGQNMLVMSFSVIPIWHSISLARPTTWGFFLLGPERGLAWLWWFPLFGCFTSLYLLFQIVLRHSFLAAIGSFWFCTSAYVLLWSNAPATLVFLGALICLTAYHLFHSSSRRVVVISALILGLSIPGFFVFIYPPWQVSVGYVSLIVFLGLFVRDRLWESVRQFARLRSISILMVLLISGALLGLFILDALPGLQLLRNTIYPGSRDLTGGNYDFLSLFRGMYNILTNYQEVFPLTNQSEASSFFFFFPALLIVSPLYKPIRSSFGVLTWLLYFYIIFTLIYMFIGFPAIIAKITLMNNVQPVRAEIGLGLASILLTLQLIQFSSNIKINRYYIYSGISITFIYLTLYNILIIRTFGFIIAPWIMFSITVISCVLMFFILSGAINRFSLLLIPCLILTSGFFNPLSRNLDFIYKSEVARAIAQTDPRPDEHNTWLCFTQTYHCNLVTMLGRKSFAGIHWYPQWGMWNKFDRTIATDQIVNRYAHVLFSATNDDNLVRVENPSGDVIRVSISPHNHIIKDLNVRYILIAGDEQSKVDPRDLVLRYQAHDSSFSIYEIPRN